MKTNNFFIRIFIVLISITFLLSSSILSAQGNETTITGVVKDSAGAPIGGASVQNLSTHKGTFSDQHGNFSIGVAKGQQLQFSFIGFLPKTIVYADQTTLEVVLAANVTKLRDIVVIGYGQQRKEAVTGSVASISGSKLREVPSANVSEALQGRLPGIAISQTSSKPGATKQIRIRGTRSLTANNDPLIVLDGIPFPGSIGDIDMNSVKSVDVLKDASATAIYGSRGANGVILITTYKGNSNEEARISYNSYQGIKKVFSQYPMMDGPEFVAMRKAAGKYNNGSDEYDSISTNWQNLLYQTGFVTNQDLTISAGTKGGSYSFGGSYYQDQAVLPTQNYRRFTIHGSIDQNIGKYFRVGITTNSNYNYTQGAQIGAGAVLGLSPIASPFNADGSYKNIINMPLNQSWVYTKSRIDSLKDQWLSQNKGYASYNSFYGEVKIPWINGLKYRINVGLNYTASNSGSYTGVGINSTNPSNPSSGSVGHSWSTDWTIENILTYNKVFKEKHHLDITALYSTEKSFYNSTFVSARNIPADALQYYNLGTAPQSDITVDPNNQTYTVWGLLSWMGRVMYSYEDKYMISATIRSDGSSRLAPGHNWHTYPAVSAGWNIANEDFMGKVSWVDELKIRAGFGQTSNQAVSPYSTLGRLASNPYNFGETGYATGYYLSRLANPYLGWEFSKTYNFGVDFSLFNNRLSGTAEYYITKTDNLLESVNLPATTGVGSYTANVGRSENKGFEFSLNGTILNRNGWTWTAGANISFNRNKITYLNSGQTQDVGNSWFVGHPINVIYDYQKVGLWNTSADSAAGYMNILEPGGNVGMIKVKYTGGYNEDGTPVRAIGPDDQQIMSVDPDYTGGFNTTVSYKGFDFTAVGVFQHGGILISTLYGSAGYLNMLSGRSNNVKVDYWTPDNTNAKYPKPGGVMSGDNPKYGSTLGYFSASYLKIQALTLGYNFAKSEAFKKSGISQLRIYFTVQNPFVMFSPFHSESGLDPETNSYGDENSAVGAYQHRLLTLGTNTPATRNYLFGINLTF